MALDSNPLLTPSTLPYRLPPFADIRTEHYREAIELGMREQRDEVEVIVSSTDPATFENTVIALERSGAMLRRALLPFHNACSADATPEVEELDEEFAPKLSAHEDAIRLDPRLYARVAELAEQLDDLGLDDEARHLVKRVHRSMSLAGAALDADGRQRLTDLNERITTLTTRFQKQLLADTNDLAVHITDDAELDGLDHGAISAAREAAEARGLDGWLITLVLPTGHPYLASLQRPETRDRVMHASRSRGSRDGDHDNRPVVLQIARLRAERARLLGFADHAGVVTADNTAGDPESVADLLHRLAEPAARNARAEADALTVRAVARNQRDVQAADWSYLTEEVRAEQYDVDLQAMRPYFELERVLRDGVFFAATSLYGIRFEERADLVGYHPGVRVFEVTEADGSAVGLFLLDLYTRDTKRGGAWMNSLVEQSSLLGDDLPVVVNNLNVPRPADGEPTLLQFDETRTLFHEFGHALHGLFARVTYPTFSGTNVDRDFVEFPSQVNEMWMLHPEVLANYAIHHETGERMPQHLVDRLLASEGFNEGFKTSEYLAAALLDQAWHRLGVDDEVSDVAAFERDALAAAGLDDARVPPRYSTAYFAHIFAGGYDAGYYSYIWSEVLDADTVEWFREHGGLTRENGDRFRELVLGIGGSRDPLEAYREFRGRDADIQPLLARRGLA